MQSFKADQYLTKSLLKILANNLCCWRGVVYNVSFLQAQFNIGAQKYVGIQNNEQNE